MLSAATQTFRSLGFAGTGVDRIAQAAGVTSGAFYAHFGSKAGAFEAAVIVGLDEVIVGIPKFQAEHGERWVLAFADYYLGAAHRQDLASGCAMTTLSPEVVRAEEDTRSAYETKMTEIVELMADGLADGSDTEKRARSWGMLGALIGALTLARAVRSPEAAQAIAAAGRDAASLAAGPTQGTSRHLAGLSDDEGRS